MISVNIICVGKIKHKFFKDAQLEYSKMLSRFCKINVLEVPDEKIPDNASNATLSQILETEGKKILALAGDMPIVSLCIEGTLVKSEDFATMLDNFSMRSGKVAFVIGGSLGLWEEIKKQSSEKISLGRITLPHQMARVVLLEQIFRGFKILNNQTYHK